MSVIDFQALEERKRRPAIDRSAHSASATAWTHSPSFAAEGQNTIVTAVTATEPEKAVFRHTASEVVPKLPFHKSIN